MKDITIKDIMQKEFPNYFGVTDVIDMLGVNEVERCIPYSIELLMCAYIQNEEHDLCESFGKEKWLDIAGYEYKEGVIVPTKQKSPLQMLIESKGVTDYNYEECLAILVCCAENMVNKHTKRVFTERMSSFKIKNILPEILNQFVHAALMTRHAFCPFKTRIRSSATEQKNYTCSFVIADDALIMTRYDLDKECTTYNILYGMEDRDKINKKETISEMEKWFDDDEELISKMPWNNGKRRTCKEGTITITPWSSTWEDADEWKKWISKESAEKE